MQKHPACLMHIYFDESGIFANPQQKDHAVSCVAALGIPDSIREELFEEYTHLTSEWTEDGAEVKGKDLHEKQVDLILKLLASYDAIAEIYAIDLGMHTGEGIEQHKLDQANGLVANLTEAHPPSFQEDVHKLKNDLEDLSTPLYAQSVLTTNAVNEILQTATIYYGLRLPSELSEFIWVFDAKGVDLTPFEQLWRQIVLPLVESGSLTTPFDIADSEVDYSHFSRYMVSADAPPEHLQGHVEHDGGSFEYIDLNLVFSESNHFLDSESEIGLQLVDIVATSFRRATMNTLQLPGWRRLGNLVVGRPGGAIQMVGLNIPGRPSSFEVPYAWVVNLINHTAKPMWPN